MNWEKLESIHSPRPSFQNPNFESMDEIRLEIHIKKDGDISNLT